jgi:type I restriction enzyme, S subunit
MEVKKGYRQTEVGVIPDEWKVKPLSELGKFKNGINKSKNEFGRGYPFVNLMDVFGIRKISTTTHELGLVNSNKSERKAYNLIRGDVLFVRSSVKPEGVGLTTLVEEDLDNTVFSGFLIRFRDSGLLNHRFKEYCFGEGRFRARLTSNSTVSANTNVNQDTLKQLQIIIPDKNQEQRAIAEALSDIDDLLEGLDRLIVKKRDLKYAAAHELLTGQTRLGGFNEEWEVKRIGDVAKPCSDRNTSRLNLPVLACSKHFGFMDSLRFFKNQVFSKDLTTYKIIRRNEIGYPANHVEEGSIGLQDLYEVALVSPIYVVFKIQEGVNSYFLHRLLKTDSYRQRFKTATSSSVDRRGSLRWPAFSEITVALPPTMDEQTAIAEALTDMESELKALEQRREKTRELKQAMMQELLTGRIRLV